MKKPVSILAMTLLSFISQSHALPFSITPVGNLPTAVILKSPVPAAYTVVNKTSRQLNNAYVNLPPYVSVESAGCGPVFSLASGASCTLNLSVSGPVNAKNPNPNQHLYVCLPGGTTCAGTNYPLNVTLLVPPEFIFIGTSSTSNGGIYVCATDVDTGNQTSCSVTGIGTNGANVFLEPQWLAFSPSGQLAYVSDAGQHPGVVWLCQLNTSTGALTGCQNSGATGLAAPAGMTFNSAGTKAYIADSSNNAVYLCNVNLLSGLLSGCAMTGPAFQEPEGIALNPANTLAYIANASSGSVSWCAIGPSGQLSGTCGDLTGFFTEPFGIAFIPSGTQAYVTDKSTSKVYLCNVDQSTGALTSSGCKATATHYPFSAPAGIALSTNLQQPSQIYVANQGSGIVAVCNYCALNCDDASQTPGELYCIDSYNAKGLSSIVGVTAAAGLLLS